MEIKKDTPEYATLVAELKKDVDVSQHAYIDEQFVKLLGILEQEVIAYIQVYIILRPECNLGAYIVP